MKKHPMVLASVVLMLASCNDGDHSYVSKPTETEKPGDNTETVIPKMTTIQNECIKLSQDLTRGGAICWISKAGSTFNIVNIADEGRYIQQSYYAGKRVDRKDEGQGAAWSPWNWNPIQVGDYKRNRAQILDAKTEGNSTYVKCIPMLWDMNNKPAEAIMEQWTEIEGNTVHVRNKLTCQRTDDPYGDGKANDQELPAVYPISTLCRLYTYNGNAPFTNAPVSELDVVELTMLEGGGGGVWGRYNDITEDWMAFVDNDGWGIGVYSPSATKFAAGRSSSDKTGTANSPATSYIAPLAVMTLMKDSVVEYEYWLVIDTLESIRKTIYDIHSKN